VPELATNAFEVFSSQAVGHENQLTRALLVLLRVSPLAHEVWLRRIGLGGIGLVGVGEPAYAFQTGTVPEVDPESQEEPARGISVFITRDTATNTGPIAASDRRQIPDALVTYLGQDKPIITVIESKVHSGTDAIQAREINLGGVEAEWDPPTPVELRWSELIDDLWSLLDLAAASGSEARLLFDFFDFVDTHYREVGPYSTLRRCGGVHERVRRRSRALLAEATEREAYLGTRGREPYVEMDGPPSLPRRVGLDLSEAPHRGESRRGERSHTDLRLSFWPADTPSQARAFYSDPDLLDRMLKLVEDSAWEGEANMHFGHFQAGYAWTAPAEEISFTDYVNYWRENLDLPSTVYRDRDPHWDDLLTQLLDAGIIDSRQPFDKDFTKTGRNKADVRPGLRLERVWDIDEATTLDEQDALVDQIKQAFAEALACFGTTPKAV
jgi:hypothetical protein